jgi:hypothetical protein
MLLVKSFSACSSKFITSKIVDGFRVNPLYEVS